MDQFIVHMRQKNLMQWNIRTTNYGRVPSNIPDRVRIDATLHDDGSESSAQTCYCASQEHAEMIASDWAEKNPGSTIMIAKTTAVVSCKPQKPIISAVTEKGVVPR
jgi:hypothetical protein